MQNFNYLKYVDLFLGVKRKTLISLFSAILADSACLICTKWFKKWSKNASGEV